MAFDIGTRNWLTSTFGKIFRFDEPMSGHTSFKIGGPSEGFAAPDDISQLTRLIKGLAAEDIPWMVMGGGTNLVVGDKGIKGVVIVLSKIDPMIRSKGISGKGRIITAGAGVQTRTLCAAALKNGLSGMSFALGIPGTLGGAVMMNAGTAIGTMDGRLAGLSSLPPDGSIETTDAANLDFSYRGWIWEIRFPGKKPPVILDCAFCLDPGNPEALKREARALMKKRINRQPTTLPSAGCIFRNPEEGPPAGQLIDRSGLKGKRIGNAQISPLHGNFIINMGKAKATDVLNLMETAQKEVFRQFGIQLEPEVQIVGY